MRTGLTAGGGMVLGIIFGAAFGHLALGMIIGMLIGAANCARSKHGQQGDGCLGAADL